MPPQPNHHSNIAWHQANRRYPRLRAEVVTGRLKELAPHMPQCVPVSLGPLLGLQFSFLPFSASELFSRFSSERLRDERKTEKAVSQSVLFIPNLS